MKTISMIFTVFLVSTNVSAEWAGDSVSKVCTTHIAFQRNTETGQTRTLQGANGTTDCLKTSQEVNNRYAKFVANNWDSKTAPAQAVYYAESPRECESLAGTLENSGAKRLERNCTLNVRLRSDEKTSTTFDPQGLIGNDASLISYEFENMKECKKAVIKLKKDGKKPMSDSCRYSVTAVIE